MSIANGEPTRLELLAIAIVLANKVRFAPHLAAVKPENFNDVIKAIAKVEAAGVMEYARELDRLLG
jgi:hypothetical protein